MTVIEKQALMAKWSLQSDSGLTMRNILSSSFSMAFDECGLHGRKSVKTIINRATKIAVKVISYYPKKRIFHAIPWRISSSLILRSDKQVNGVKDLSKKEIIRCLRERVIKPYYAKHAGVFGGQWSF